MASATIDHMISLTVFIMALLLFIGVFSQNIQTAVVYESNQVLSTKTSDLLDTMLLNPGVPLDWGKADSAPDCFGLQDPDYPQYTLSTFSLMRFNSASNPQVYFPPTSTYYSNTTTGFGSCLLVPNSMVLNYSTVSKMLGINGTYGFQLSLTPTINVLANKTSTDEEPLQILVNVTGIGYQLANAPVIYSLYLVNQNQNEYPSFTVFNGTTTTDETGIAQVLFPQVIDRDSQSYAFIAYSYLFGLKGMGYYVHVPQTFTKSVVPMVDSFSNQSILLAHSDSVGESEQPSGYSQLSYNASFGILTDDYTLRQVTLDSATSTGNVTVGSGLPTYATVNVPDNDGILIVTYKDTMSGQVGIVLMPWGLGSMAFPMTLGANPIRQEWVTTDIRQVTISGFAYEAKLALWNLQGTQEISQ
jgi:hypothetical protein